MTSGRIGWRGPRLPFTTARRRAMLVSLLGMLLQGCVGTYRSSANCPVLEVKFEGVMDAANLARARGTFSVSNQGATTAKIPLADLDGPLADDTYISVYKRGAPGEEWSQDDPDFRHSRPYIGMLELRPGEQATFLPPHGCSPSILVCGTASTQFSCLTSDSGVGHGRYPFASRRGGGVSQGCSRPSCSASTVLPAYA